jgi:hypothetical protein
MRDLQRLTRYIDEDTAIFVVDIWQDYATDRVVYLANKDLMRFFRVSCINSLVTVKDQDTLEIREF